MREQGLFPLFFFFVVALISAPASLADEPADVRQWVEAIDRAELSGPGIDAAGKTYSVGHLAVQFGSGKLFPVVARDSIVGMFFSGEAQFTYTSGDPLEIPNFRTNLRRATKYQLQETSLADESSAMLIWDPDRARAMPGDRGWPEEDAPEQDARQFDKLRKRCSKDWGFPPELFLAHMLVQPAVVAPAVVQIHAARHDLLYVYDTLRFQDEEIYSLDKVEGGGYDTLRGRRYLEVLSSQPIGRSRLEIADPRFRLIDVDVELTNTRGDDADLKLTETFEILEPGRVLDLGLLSVRISQRERFYQLNSVTTDDGSDLPFVHRKNRLLVQLPREMRAGEKVTLVFHTSGEILYRPAGDSYWDLGTIAWLPLPERLDMQFFSYHAVVKVQKPFTPFSPGVTVRRWEEGKLACAEFKEQHPIMFPVLFAGKYRIYEQSHEGTTIRVATYVFQKPERMKQMVNNLFALMELYQKLLGDYPYTELNVIEVNDLGFGQAPPGIIFITAEAFQPVPGWSVGINARVAHELAHTWWGDITPWASPQDQWLSESTADYYAAVAMSILWKESKFDDILLAWIRESKHVKDNASILLANQLSGDGWWDDRYALLYNKGPLALHALRQELGDNRFFSVFKSLLTNFKYKHLTTKDTIEMINWVTKQDHSDWAERYILGTEWPDMKALRGKRSKGKKGS